MADGASQLSVTLRVKPVLRSFHQLNPVNSSAEAKPCQALQKVITVLI